MNPLIYNLRIELTKIGFSKRLSTPKFLISCEPDTASEYVEEMPNSVHVNKRGFLVFSRKNDVNYVVGYYSNGMESFRIVKVVDIRE